MSFGRTHYIRPSRNFRLHELREVEREHADSIRMNLGQLRRRAATFSAGRMLFHSCAERQVFDFGNRTTYHEWQLCAARDCVMSIYHFGRIIDGIDESLGNCPQLRDMIDLKRKREAKKIFIREFPSSIKLRHAIAHSAERSKTVKDTRRHGKRTSRLVELNPALTIQASDDTSFLLALDSIYGTTFSSMWDGNLIRCEINDRSGILLDQITEAYWLAFEAIIDPIAEPLPKITYSAS